MQLYPKCKLKQNQTLAIRYDGYVVPCCHFGGDDHQQLRELLGDKIEQTHVTYSSIDEINRSEAFQIIEHSFSTNPIAKCVRMCSDPGNLSDAVSLSNTEYSRIQLVTRGTDETSS